VKTVYGAKRGAVGGGAARKKGAPQSLTLKSGKFSWGTAGGEEGSFQGGGGKEGEREKGATPAAFYS